LQYWCRPATSSGAVLGYGGLYLVLRNWEPPNSTICSGPSVSGPTTRRCQAVRIRPGLACWVVLPVAQTGQPTTASTRAGARSRTVYPQGAAGVSRLIYFAALVRCAFLAPGCCGSSTRSRPPGHQPVPQSTGRRTSKTAAASELQEATTCNCYSSAATHYTGSITGPELAPLPGC